MIHTLREEINVLVYLVFYGIFIISTYDCVLYFSNHFINKKSIRIIIEIIFCIIQIIIAYIFSYNLAYGYIPIYFILLVIVGICIYIMFLKKSMYKLLEYLSSKIKKHKRIIKVGLLNLIYNLQLIKVIKNTIIKINKEANLIQKSCSIISK